MFSLSLLFPLFFGLIDGLPLLPLLVEDTGLETFVHPKEDDVIDIGFVSKTLTGDIY